MRLFCFAPLVMIGALLSINTPTHRVERQDGAVIDLQTCKTGFGAHVNATTSGLYALGGHYGLTFVPARNWTVTFQPRAGLSYVDHPVRDIWGTNTVPMQAQFEVGAQFILGYGPFHSSVGYQHFSNAGMKPPNIGLDQITLMWGVEF